MGPFRILEDAEYFGIAGVAAEHYDDDDDDDNDFNVGNSNNTDGNNNENNHHKKKSRPTLEERHQAYVKSARQIGEGIHQANLAPSFACK